MKKIESIHNKTKELLNTELPYNKNNILLNENDLRDFFNKNGLENVNYNNINLYRNAFVHKSYCTMKNLDFTASNSKCPDNTLPLQDVSYERLEYLGDAILNFVVANYLYLRFPDQHEGFLSKIRTKIVNGKMLGYLANKIGFNKFAIISKQVEEANGRNNYKIMEDIFEAFIGALFIDFSEKVPIQKINPLSGIGFYIAELWIISIIENHIDFTDLILQKTNYKDMLITYMQNTYQIAPRFYELDVSTKDNIKIFKYCVKDVANLVLATAIGYSKKEAENNVSKEALIYYGQNL